MKLFKSSQAQIACILLVAAVWKLILLFWDVIPFNSDEAVVGLMAKHINMGERPIFFYGQAYMGSLDAFLVGGCFLLFGQNVWCIRLVQVLLYLGTIATTVWIGKEVFGSYKTGLFAALMLAVPTVNVTLYTTASLGGYGEALLLGNLIMLVALVVVRREIQSGNNHFPFMQIMGWGFLVGLGLWANGLTLVYSVPSGIYLLWAIWNQRKSWTASFLVGVFVGIFIGAVPWWIYAVSNGPEHLIQELLGKAVAVERVSWFMRTANHIVNFLLLGISVILGLRPPWSVQWLGVPLIPFILVFWSAVVWFFIKRLNSGNQERSRYALLTGVGVFLIAGFLFTPFGVDPSGRYFLPLAVSLALIGAQMILSVTRRPWQVGLLLALVVGYNILGTLECVFRFPPGLTTQFYEPTRIDHRTDQELIHFLQQEGEKRGYTNYWVAYPLAFLSNEDLIFAPRLPYHLDLRYTPRDDRYAPYTNIVDTSNKVAYITTHNPLLDQHLRIQLNDLGITWQERKIGDYQIFYKLSRVVRPQEIGLGDLSE